MWEAYSSLAIYGGEVQGICDGFPSFHYIFVGIKTKEESVKNVSKYCTYYKIIYKILISLR